jgi:transcriptional regulator with XRE-family HTH domain
VTSPKARPQPGYFGFVRLYRHPKGSYDDPFRGNSVIAAHEVVKAARTWADITQTELAQRSGINQRTISAWERGRQEPSFAAVMKVVGACGLDLMTAPVARDLEQPIPARLMLLSPTASRYGPADAMMKIRRLRRAQLRQYASERPGGQTTN